MTIPFGVAGRLGIAFFAFSIAPAFAETVAITCEANAMFNSPEMTLVYEGDEDGTLTITASFGKMSLPANKEEREGTDDSGQLIKATGIRAFGTASVIMPDKAAIEACVKGKLPPDELSDSDFVFMTAMSCGNEAPFGTEPIEINAYVEIALVPMVYVGVKRTFIEPTDLIIGKIDIETYPNCAIKE